MVVPTRLKILNGNPGKRPILPEPEPRVSDAVPPPPEYLGDDARGEWLRVAPELYSLGLLTVVDLQLLGAYCDCFGTWVRARRELASDKRRGLRNPLHSVAKTAMRDMLAFAVQFGLSPSSRARMTIKTERPASKFGKLLA
jgi:P27 family predicted phage terminase small subunit